MADNEFKVKIITPDRVFYETDATMIEFTTTEGDIGVYANHVPLTAVLAPGEVHITTAGGVKVAAVHSGFSEILPDQVTLLAEVAEWPDEIDVSRAQEALKRAEDRLAKKTENLDVARAELEMRRALVRLNVAEK